MSSIHQHRLAVARDLHDTVLQEFLVILMQLRRTRESAENLSMRIEECMTATERGIGAVRQLLVDLRGASVERTPRTLHAPLASAIAAMLSAVLGRAPLRYRLHCEPIGLGGRAQAEVVNIVREAATNVVRHANARNVECRITAHRSGIRIDVRDDGDGFVAHAAPAGYGLVGMRERAALLGGSVEIDSRPGAGTSVVVRVPAESDARRLVASLRFDDAPSLARSHD